VTAESILQFLAGFLVLVLGAEILVRGAARLAGAFGVPPLVVGLSVVAFGTSAPELAICLQSSFAGKADIGVGNILGSNISNVLLILGLASVMAPLTIAQRVVRLDVPIMIGLSVLTLALAAINGRLDWWDGALLVVMGAAYTAFTIRQSRRESRRVRDEYRDEFGPERDEMRGWPLYTLMILVGLGLLVMGSDWLVRGAVLMARFFGLSELVIGLTVIALGTSMPELVTSVVAGLRGERDIAVGNIIGSNIMNLVSVLGITSLVGGGLAVSPAALSFDFPVMIAAAVACLPIFYSGFAIKRWEGLLFVGYYVAYVAFLLLDAGRHDGLEGFSYIMMVFVIPLTVVTLGIMTVRSARERRRGA
jgi:cation:H+ antiporter